MPSVRRWTGGRLLATWIVLILGLALFRLVMDWGTYEGTVENHQVTRVSGQWSPAFASRAQGVATTVVALVLAWITGLWVAGRRERARRRASAEARNRGPLM